MDFSKQFRQHYLGAVPHSLYVSFCWILGGVLGDLVSEKASIIFFLLASMVNFPMGEIIRKQFFRYGPAGDEIAPLKHLFMLMSFIIPMSLPLIYLASRDNIALFYPAFSIIVGAHYLPFYYGYKLRSFIVAGTIIWLAGTACALYFPHSFSLAAYTTGIIILGMAMVNLSAVRSEMSS
jgi:hypothetical protein